MKKEIIVIANQIRESFDGEPWYGRSLVALLNEVDPQMAYQKPEGQHSILELLYHMINWRLFTINRLERNAQYDVKHFETNDWQLLDHTDQSLWPKGLEQLKQTQKTLLDLVNQLDDEMLDEPVKERDYTKRTLINGIIQHDIYHAGQVAYIRKMLAP